MVMASLTLPVAGEKNGFGSTVGPASYTGGAGNGVAVTVQGVNRVNRVLSVTVQPTVAGTDAKFEGRVDSISGNIVRVRVYGAQAAVADHAAADIAAAAAAHAVHSHPLAASNDAGAVATITVGGALLAASSGIQVVTAGGAAGDGVRNNTATQAHAAGVAPPAHTITAAALLEVIDTTVLSGHTITVSAKGF